MSLDSSLRSQPPRKKALVRLESFFKILLDFAIGSPRRSLCILALAMGLALLGLSRIRLEMDIYDILDPSLKSSQNQWLMREQFADTNSIFVYLVADEAIPPAQTCKIKNFLHQYVNTSAEVDRILAPWSLRRPQKEGARTWYRNIVPDPCAESAVHGIQTPGAELETTPWRNIFRGKSPNQIALEVVFHDDGEKKFDIKSIDLFATSLRSFLQREAPGIRSHIFGQVSFRWYLYQILKKDYVWNLGLMIFFLIFFYLFLGTWRAGFYYAITLVFTSLLLFGTMGLLELPIDIMSNCLFLLVALAGVSDFLFVSSVQLERNTPWQKSLYDLALPSFFTSLTTVLGFASLSVSTLPIISRFGRAAALGAGFEWISTFLILPLILTTFRAQKNWAVPERKISGKWMDRWNRFRPARWITLILVAAALIGVSGINKLNVNEAILDNFSQGHPLRLAYDWLKQDKGWQGQVFVVFGPKVSDAEIRATLEKMANQNFVFFIENVLKIEDYLTSGFSPMERQSLLQEMSLGPLKRYRSGDGSTRVPVYTTSLEVPELRRVVASLRTLCQDRCFLAGQTIVYLEYSERISQTLVESFLSSLVIVALTLLGLVWLTGSRQYLPLILSALWGPFIMVGLMWWAQTPVTSITSVFFAVIVGLTGDNAIQYLFASPNLELGANKRSNASLIQTLLFCCSSVFIALQSLTPMKILGALFFLGFFVTYVGDLWILKGLLHKHIDDAE